MDVNKAIKIIDLDPAHTSKEESLEAYEAFFKSFGVDIIDKNGNYKTIYRILKEAAMNRDKEK